MKLNILFIVNKCKINTSGNCTLFCKLSYRKTRKTFSTGLFINPKYWNSKKQKVLTEAENQEFTNTQLNLIKSKINWAFLMLQVQVTDFTIDDVYTLYKGEKLSKEYNVIEYFERYLNRLKR